MNNNPIVQRHGFAYLSKRGEGAEEVSNILPKVSQKYELQITYTFQ
jgi:hypothetical protein